MLKLYHLRKTFNNTVAVADLSLEVGKGEVFGLLGPNGAGKTTTVNMAVGLLVPDSGEIDVNGLGSPLNPAVRSIIGVAPQALALYDELTAQENLEFFARIQGVAPKKIADKTAWALDFVALQSRRKHRVKTFSGGMKRRLNLAAALVHDPLIIFLDEPTVGVDPQSRNAIFKNIEMLRETGRTVIYTTHYMEEAQRLCDRVGIIDHGKLIALGTVDQLIAQYGGQSILIADSPSGRVRIVTEDPLAELLKMQKQGQLSRFRVESPDLEVVFLNLTGRKLRD